MIHKIIIGPLFIFLSCPFYSLTSVTTFSFVFDKVDNVYVLFCYENWMFKLVSRLILKIEQNKLQLIIELGLFFLLCGSKVMILTELKKYINVRLVIFVVYKIFKIMPLVYLIFWLHILISLLNIVHHLLTDPRCKSVIALFSLIEKNVPFTISSKVSSLNHSIYLLDGNFLFPWRHPS